MRSISKFIEVRRSSERVLQQHCICPMYKSPPSTCTRKCVASRNFAAITLVLSSTAHASFDIHAAVMYRTAQIIGMVSTILRSGLMKLICCCNIMNESMPQTKSSSKLLLDSPMLCCHPGAQLNVSAVT